MANKSRRNREERFTIGGMFCPNCQRVIESRLRSMPGVREAEADYVSGAARVTLDPEAVSMDDIRRAITELGYEIDEDRTSAFIRTVSLMIVIVGAYVLLQRFGVLNLLVPSRLADGSMGYGLLFLTGLASSVHCIAMCGGINLSQSLPAAESKAGKLAAFAPTALYNLGRVISYTVIGAILGGVGYILSGTGVGVPVLLQGILKLAAGALMVVMGINMLGLFPGLRRVTARLPGLTRGRVRSSRPFVVGLLNGLMPCGPLQSVQIIALASGHPLVGALSMLAFSLGTVPLMLGLGAVVSALGQRFARIVLTVGAVLVTVLGLAMLSQGGSLSGMLSQERLLHVILGLCLVGAAAAAPISGRGPRIAALAGSVILFLGLVFGLPGIRSADRSGKIAEAMEENGVQVVYSTLESGGYPSIRVSRDIPVRWIIQAPEGSVNGCNYRMLLSEYGIVHEFTEGENVIEFTPSETGAVAYTCWMGMLHGTIFVE